MYAAPNVVSNTYAILVLKSCIHHTEFLHVKETLTRARWGSFASKMGILHNKQSTLTKSLEILMISFRFTYIEALVILGNLLMFFDLKFEYFPKSFTFQSLACNFNASTANLGLCQRSGIYFIKSVVNQRK